MRMGPVVVRSGPRGVAPVVASRSRMNTSSSRPSTVSIALSGEPQGHGASRGTRRSFIR